MMRLWNRLAGQPPFQRKRIRLWLLLMLVLFVVWGVRYMAPSLRMGAMSADGIGPIPLLALFLGAMLCEFIDSSLGMGYGTTLTPVLLIAGFEPMQIVPCVLLSELASGLTAGVMHHHDGNVDLLRDRSARSAALTLAALSAVGAIAAVTFAFHIPKLWLSSIIAVIILSVGVLTLATFNRRLTYRRGHLLLLGAVAAFNKGLSGGGYGPLVTAGQVVSGLPAKHAVAITSWAEAVTCAVGLAAYLVAGGRLDWGLAVPLTLGALMSVPLATLAVRRLPEALLRASVGGATCMLGLVAVIKIVF